MSDMLKLVITDPKEIEAVMAVRNGRKGAKSIGDLIEPTSDVEQNDRMKSSLEKQYRIISNFIRTLDQKKTSHNAICRKFIENGFIVNQHTRMMKYRLSLADENDQNSIEVNEITLLGDNFEEMTDSNLTDNIYSDGDAYWVNDRGTLMAYLKDKMPCTTFNMGLISNGESSFVNVYAQVLCTNAVYTFFTRCECKFGNISLRINDEAHHISHDAYDKKTLRKIYDTCSTMKFEAVKADMMKCEKFIDALSKKLTTKEDASKEKDYED